MSEAAVLQEPEAPPAEPAPAPDIFDADETDMDALHILPLDIVPFETPALKRARLIKNVRLDTVIEIFKDESAGSGQVAPEDMGKLFEWPEGTRHPDQDTIEALSTLPSYDVFSLRVEMRRIGIAVNDHEALRLSPEKNAELTEYMHSFTRPLIQQVYAETEQDINDVSQIIDMFKNPDKGQAIENLKRLSDTLDVKLHEIPQFLEDYGDIFMSLAYFKNCLDKIVPNILDFLQAIGDLQSNFQLKNDKNVMDTCVWMEDELNNVTASITGRFESFHRHTNAMWDDLSAESFQKVKKLIASHHTTVGGVLCGLAVKMAVWQEKFGRDRGGPQARADFVMSEMRHGIDRIERIENSAPTMSDI